MPGLRAIPSSALAAVRTHSPATLTLIAIWMLAISLDATSTILMSSRGFEEANMYALPVMNSLGVAPATLLLSAWAAVLAFFSLARPSGLYAATLVWTLRVILAVKLAVGISNVLLAVYGVDFL